MNHDYHIDGLAFRLRPVTTDDAAFILSLRTNPNLNQYLNPVSGKVEDQIKWIESYFVRENDYYFIVEKIKNNQPEGLISLYDIIPEKKEGEWGRWILKEESNAAVESASLIYDFAFSILKLERIYCRTVADNKKVCSFHDSCGLTRSTILKNYFLDKHDAQEHIMTNDNWSKQKPMLQRIIQRTAAA